MLKLLAMLALVQVPAPTPHHRLVQQPNLPRASNLALPAFEFAPLNGNGMGAACACASPTGANGEAVTFTRASSATCLATVGAPPQRVANGDMVTCTSNQARVMPGADGTSVNGLLIEAARTNSLLRSEQLDNAAWTTEGSAGRVLVVTADQATAPQNTLTADALNIFATSGSQFSGVYQSSLSISTPYCSIYVRTADDGGTAGDTTDVCVYNGAWNCTGCAHVPSAWTRCSVSTADGGGTGSVFEVGNMTLINGGTARNAQMVYATDGQCESTAGLAAAQDLFPSSYVVTTSAAVTRAAETAFASIASTSWTTMSGAITVVEPPATASSRTPFQWWFSTAPDNQLMAINNGPVVSNTLLGRLRINNVSNNVTSATGFTAATAARLAIYYDGANRAACVGGACTTAAGALTLPTGVSRFYLGGRNAGAGFEVNGVVKQACLDSSPSRCR